METYRLSSKMSEQEREYLIQTTNDANLGSVMTTVYVDGVPAETIDSPHPSDINPEEVLSFVKVTHGEKKEEIEKLLQAFGRAVASHDLQMMYHLGTAFYYKGFYYEASELFVNCINLNHSHHQAYNFLSQADLARGRFKEAVTHYDNGTINLSRGQHQVKLKYTHDNGGDAHISLHWQRTS